MRPLGTRDFTALKDLASRGDLTKEERVVSLS